MICAVTGANGFVGRQLLKELCKADVDIRALSRSHPVGKDNQGVEWFQGDLAEIDEAGLSGFLDGVDILLHCAAELYDESLMEALHVSGTLTLVHAATRRIRHFVLLSSCGVYGPVREGVITEKSPENAVGVYERTKLQSEKIVLDAGHAEAFITTILRPSIIYGEEMTNNSLRGWIRAVQKRLFFFIGRPGAQANYVHVEDVAKALVHCVVHPQKTGGVYNLSNGCSLEEAVAFMCAALHCPMVKARLPLFFANGFAILGSLVPRFPLSRSRVDALTTRVVYSSERITNELGFVPQVPMEQGIERMIRSMAPSEEDG